MCDSEWEADVWYFTTWPCPHGCRVTRARSSGAGPLKGSHAYALHARDGDGSEIARVPPGIDDSRRAGRRKLSKYHACALVLGPSQADGKSLFCGVLALMAR